MCTDAACYTGVTYCQRADIFSELIKQNYSVRVQYLSNPSLRLTPGRRLRHGYSFHSKTMQQMAQLEEHQLIKIAIDRTYKKQISNKTTQVKLLR